MRNVNILEQYNFSATGSNIGHATAIIVTPTAWTTRASKILFGPTDANGHGGGASDPYNTIVNSTCDVR